MIMEATSIAFPARGDGPGVDNRPVATPGVVFADAKITRQCRDLRFVHIEKRSGEAWPTRIGDRHHGAERFEEGRRTIRIARKFDAVDPDMHLIRTDACGMRTGEREKQSVARR